MRGMPRIAIALIAGITAITVLFILAIPPDPQVAGAHARISEVRSIEVAPQPPSQQPSHPDPGTTRAPAVTTHSADQSLQAGTDPSLAPASLPLVVDPRWKLVRINFQHPTTITPDGYLPDTGAVFGPHDNGFTYGWIGGQATEARERGVLTDKRLDTFIHFMKGPSRLGPGTKAPDAPGGSDGYSFSWAIAVPNGVYEVEIVMGDPSYSDHLNSVMINEHDYVDQEASDAFDKVACTIRVTGGKISVKPGATARNPVICYIHIVQLELTLDGKEL